VAQIIDDDSMLLQLIAQQSRELHMRDTLFLEDSMVVFCDTIWKSYPHPLCLPLMYVPQSMPSLRDTTIQNPYTIENIRKNALRYILHNHADMFVSVSDPSRLEKLNLRRIRNQKAVIRDVEVEKVDKSKVLRSQHSPWRKSATLSLQLTQNYATNNWHQGSANAFAMLWNAKALVNYKSENISWENTVDWRVGASTVSQDSLRVINTTDDKLQVYSKFGYQMHKKWYLSMYADFRTNLFPNFQKNSQMLNTTFLTPIRYSMGVGVDCKVVKGLSINFSPVTYKMVYALNTDPEYVNVTEFGISEGTDMLNEVGSSLRLEWKWKPLREIALDTKFYFFTNYKQIETELEINVDFIINRYMSAKLMLHPRYDGTIDEVAEQKSKLQFKEVISVGFAHTFR
jgi:hypothetical protein